MTMDLFNALKKNRPSVSLEILKKIGLPFAENSLDADVSFDSLMKRILFASGINTIVQVNDCETAADFTESDSGTFDIAASAATGKRVGTNCMKLAATAACDGTQYVQSKLINESEICGKISGTRFMDWSDTSYIGFWNHTESSGDFGTAGEMKMALVYDGGQISDQVSIGATVTTVHQWEEHALSEFTNADLTKVEGIRFYSSNVNAGEYVQYDDIIRYEISLDGYPYYGCSFPIKNGTTLVQGNIGTWSVDGMITGSAALACLGPAFLPDGASVVGTGKRDKWAMFPGGVSIGMIRANTTITAGDLQQWVSGTNQALLTDVTTTATALGVAMALESAGAQYDDVFCLFMKNAKSA